MDNQQFIEYFYQHGINDITYENEVISNGTDSVNITNFKLNYLGKSPRFVADLEANNLNSKMLIAIIKAVILALRKYDYNVLTYLSMMKQPSIIPPAQFLEELAKNHFHMVQAYTYLPPDIQDVVNRLSEIIEKPDTPNDLDLQDAYYRVLEEYEIQTQESGKPYIPRLGNVNYYGTDEEEVNEFGFVSVAAIALIVINLGIIIATLIFNH